MKRWQQGSLLAAGLVSAVFLILAAADAGMRVGQNAERCAFKFPKWLGCALANHENLSGGLVGGAGALFAAWLAWQAITRQIEADRELAMLVQDYAYQALQADLRDVVDVLVLYWRVTDAALNKREWRRNGIILLKSLHTGPNGLQKMVDQGLAKDLDPLRRREFFDLMRSLKWLEEQLQRPADERLWLENMRTMLSHFDRYLQEFDPTAATKFQGRKRGRIDHRSLAAHLESLVAKFEKDGNV